VEIATAGKWEQVETIKKEELQKQYGKYFSWFICKKSKV
jgi:hypothetical protein